MPLTVTLDFDGTCTTRDIGYSICKHFVGDGVRPPVQAWLRGELSLPEAQALIWPQIRASRLEVMSFVSEVAALRPGLDRVIALCRARGWPLCIASGGFDFYLREILAERFAELNVICNRAWFTDAGMAVDFPHADLSCGRCAVCKGLIVDRLKRAGHDTVFIGDGLSDRCAAGRADRLFTIRGCELDEYCRSQSIACEPVDDLNDVAERLAALE